NQGKLLVGVDNVQLSATFDDVQAPVLSSVRLRNPGFLGSPDGLTPHTTDPTIVGQVGDNGGVNNLDHVAFDVNNDGDFNGPDDFTITNWDPLGNFSFTIPNLTPGLHTIGVQAVDKAGLKVTTLVPLFLQTGNGSEWQAYGPNTIDVTNQGHDYTNV